MGKLRGDILLDEKKVKALRRDLRKDERIPHRTKGKIELVFKMAIRYINWTRRFERLYGKYEECFPCLARGICETFYADDTELAACFRTSPATIERWQRLYPEFKKHIRDGRRRFARQGGSNICRQRWFRLRFATIARNLCKKFKTTKRQISRCFGIKARTQGELNEWMNEYHYETTYTRLKDIRNRAFSKVVGRICLEFKPDNEQLAYCLGVSVKELEEWLAVNYELRNAINFSRQGSEIMAGFERSIGSDTGQAGKSINNEEQEKKSGSEQGENPADIQTPQG